MTLSQFLLDIAAASRHAVPGWPDSCAVARLVGPDWISIVDAHDAARELENYTGMEVGLYFAQGLLAGFDGEEWYECINAADANGYALGCRLRKEVLQ